MIPEGDTRPGCDIVEKKNPEEEPIPAAKQQISGNSRKSEQGSSDKETARYPFHTIERYVLEHEIRYIAY